jgi:ADP-ribosylation factor-like protein 6
MGFFTSLKKLFSKSEKVCVLVVGLDNSGKSTIINYLKPDKRKSVDIAPTIGFSVDEFDILGMRVTCFDMSGQGKYRDLWENYYSQVDAIIFVLDASDKLRLAVAREELSILLEKISQHKNSSGFELQSINKNFTVLFMANKMDLAESASAVDCADILDLENLLPENVQWCINATNAITGEGVDNSVSWLGEKIKQGKKIRR